MTRGAPRALLLAAALVATATATATETATRYLGREVGALSSLHHGVRGRVFAVDARTLYVHDLHYDGQGPAAYFYVGSSKSPDAGASGARRLRDERGGAGPLRRYRGEGVTLSLPEGVTFKDIRWFSIWCDEFAVNFGDVSIPRALETPRPARLGALRGVHGVSSDPVVVVDAQTLLVPNFSYDGEAPDAKFWVGRGEKPSPQGVRIPDENGKEAPLRKYDRKTIVLTLPGELTVFDIGHFGVWCEAFTVNFGHVPLPRAQLANVPPSLKMLGVSPQSKLNCEVLHDELAFEVRWAVAGDSVVLQLVAKLEDGEYMSFGVSGDAARSQMVGGDVAVAWLDKASLKGHAVDYYLDAKSQCAGVRGSCPDERLGEKTNSLRLLNAALVNGYSIVTYQRGLRAADQLDLPLLTNQSQPVIWAIGPLNSRNEVSYHSHFLKSDKFIEFGRPPVWNCPMPETEEEQGEVETPASVAPAAPARSPVEKQEVKQSAVIKPNPVPTPAPAPRADPWEIPAVQCHEPADGVFYAQMGPTGGKQGYSAITGHVGWGISWYINGLLIPEVNVVRGKKYTFVVEGGSDASVPARYHPFYITNDPVGGFFHKSEEEKQGVEIYAGVRRTRSGELVPSGVGRLCNWTPDASGPEADEYPSFGAYQRSLTLVCEEGSPGVVSWVPDKDTPDTVYYQCFTHRHLGWKINVIDECDAEPEASQLVERVVAPPTPARRDQDLLTGEESIQVASRVKPDSNFLVDHNKKVEKIINTNNNYNDFSNVYLEDDEAGGYRRPPTNQSEYELPISKAQIKEVIQAAEVLESQAQEEFLRNATKNSGPFPDNVNDMFLAEQPIGEHDEFVVEQGKVPSNFMLPPNQRPLTLQAVLHPHPNGKQNGPMMRPPFRRPTPPEIKLRRPPYQNKGPNNGYPFTMPNPHGPHPGQMNSMKKHYSKHPNPHHPSNMGNMNTNMNNNNRPPMPAVPPMKAMPTHGPSPVYKPAPPKQGPKIPHGVVQSIIMGKPSGIYPPHSQTLSLGKSDIIANQIVKSQITLPGISDAITQHTMPQISIVPGQIILGKPMENPVPLDQQMIPTKHHSVIKASTQQPEYQYQTTHRVNPDVQHAEIKPSDFMEESADRSTVSPAVNTGFKPSSIVIESGFKPIIREPLMASEDRITDFDSERNPNRREDIDMEDDYDEAPQAINHNHAYPSDKITQSFEPMFIPSPEDHILPTHDRTKEVFPSNHAKEDRPHPVYIKSEIDVNALFSKKNMEREAPSEMAMDSDRVSPQYLPPDTRPSKSQQQKQGEPTFTSYDGKTVSAISLTRVPDFNVDSSNIFSKLTPHSSADSLLNTPQFGPYRGGLSDEVLRQISGNPTNDAPINNFPDTRTTHLKLVNSYTGNPLDLLAAGSEIDEVKEKKDDEDNDNVKEDKEEYEEDEEYDDEEEESKKRHKRETQATQFEAGNTEQTSTQKESLTQNQVDFEHQSSASSHSLHLHWLLNSVLLLLCMKLM